MKVQDALEFRQRLTAFAGKQLPLKVAYKLSKLTAKLDREAKEFEQFRGKLVERIGKPIEGKPGAYQVPTEHQAEYQKEIAELLEADAGWDLRPILTQEDLDLLEARGVQASAAELAALEPIIAEAASG